jgi:hypothetical protein
LKPGGRNGWYVEVGCGDLELLERAQIVWAGLGKTGCGKPCHNESGSDFGEFHDASLGRYFDVLSLLKQAWSLDRVQPEAIYMHRSI